MADFILGTEGPSAFVLFLSGLGLLLLLAWYFTHRSRITWRRIGAIPTMAAAFLYAHRVAADVWTLSPILWSAEFWLRFMLLMIPITIFAWAIGLNLRKGSGRSPR